MLLSNIYSKVEFYLHFSYWQACGHVHKLRKFLKRAEIWARIIPSCYRVLGAGNISFWTVSKLKKIYHCLVSDWRPLKAIHKKIFEPSKCLNEGKYVLKFRSSINVPTPIKFEMPNHCFAPCAAQKKANKIQKKKVLNMNFNRHKISIKNLFCV